MTCSAESSIMISDFWFSLNWWPSILVPLQMEIKKLEFEKPRSIVLLHLLTEKENVDIETKPVLLRYWPAVRTIGLVV